MNKASLFPALTLAALAGCQSGPMGAIPHFGLEDVPHAVAGPAGAAAARGQVTVGFQRLLPRARHVLSTLADVDHVVVTLTPASGAAQNQTVPKAAITAGQVSATFTDVAAGAGTFAIQVFDAAGNVIGSSSGPIAVTAGQTTTVSATISLSPNFAPTPAPSSGSGGSGGATTGNVQANLGLQDGQQVQSLALGTLLQVDGDGGIDRVVAGTGGTYWATGTRGVIHFDGSGTLLGRIAATQIPAAGELALEPSGNLLVKANVNAAHATTLYRFSPSGTLLASVPGVNTNLGDLAGNTNGIAWAALYDTSVGTGSAVALGADQSTTTLASVAAVAHVAADRHGHFLTFQWEPDGNAVVPSLNKLNPDGTVLWSHRIDGTAAPGRENVVGLGVDAADRAWLLRPSTVLGQDYQLEAYGPDGQLLASLALPAGLGAPEGFNMVPAFGAGRVQFDAAGNVYLLYGVLNERVVLLKVRPDDTLAGAYYLPEKLSNSSIPTWMDWAIGSDDKLLVAFNGQGDSPGLPTIGELLYNLP